MAFYLFCFLVSEISNSLLHRPRHIGIYACMRLGKLHRVSKSVNVILTLKLWKMRKFSFRFKLQKDTKEICQQWNAINFSSELQLLLICHIWALLCCCCFLKLQLSKYEYRVVITDKNSYKRYSPIIAQHNKKFFSICAILEKVFLFCRITFVITSRVISYSLNYNNLLTTKRVKLTWNFLGQ